MWTARRSLGSSIPHTTAFLFPIGETFDVGVDTRTPVDDDYQVPFRFNGKIDKLTVKLGPVKLIELELKADARKISLWQPD